MVRVTGLGLAALCASANASQSLPSRLCFTAQGTSLVEEVPTTTVTSTVSFVWTQSKIVTPTVYVDASPTADIESVSGAPLEARAVSTGSADMTVTSTKFVTTTIQRTSTTTSVVTLTVTSQPTAALTTPAGFTPLASNANITAAGGAARRRDTLGKRRAFLKRKDDAGSDQLLLNPSAGLSKAKFPESVLCVVYVPEIVATEIAVTAPTTRILARAADPAVVASTTSSSKPGTKSTTSATGKASASTSKSTTTITVTKTSSVSIYTTRTLTSTSTTTTYLPAASSFSICQPNNFVHSVGGHGLGFMDDTSSTFFGTGISAADCCAACQLSGSCAGFLSWFDQNFCILFNSPAGACDASQAYWGFFTDDNGDRPGASVGNGNCGQAIYEGNGDWCENVFSGPCSEDG